VLRRQKADNPVAAAAAARTNAPNPGGVSITTTSKSVRCPMSRGRWRSEFGFIVDKRRRCAQDAEIIGDLEQHFGRGRRAARRRFPDRAPSGRCQRRTCSPDRVKPSPNAIGPNARAVRAVFPVMLLRAARRSPFRHAPSIVIDTPEQINRPSFRLGITGFFQIRTKAATLRALEKSPRARPPCLPSHSARDHRRRAHGDRYPPFRSSAAIRTSDLPGRLLRPNNDAAE
jgi:hypothetical protein